MSSTESSNWDQSPRSRPRNDLFEAERARQASPIPIQVTSDPSTTDLMNNFLGLTTENVASNLGYVSTPDPPPQAQPTNTTTAPPYWTNPHHSIPPATQSFPANPNFDPQFRYVEFRDADPASSPSQAQNNPQWEAARSAVLNTVTTSQDLNSDTSNQTPIVPKDVTPAQQFDDPTPTQTSMATPRARGSSRSRGSTRGSRRGAGGTSSSTRRPKIKIEPASEDSVPTLGSPTVTATDTPTPLTAPAPGTARGGRPINRGGRPRGSRAGGSSARAGRTVNRGGRPRGSRAGIASSTAAAARKGVKRRRRDLSDDDDDEGSDVSEKMALPMLSSSGRRITQTGQFGGMLGNGVGGGVIDLEADEEEDGEGEGGGGRGRGRGRGAYHHAAWTAAAVHGNNNTTSAAATRSPNAGGTGGRGNKRKRLSLLNHNSTTATTTNKDSALAAVCKNCGRGHSPSSNQIVFCDTCNTPWHQYCHDRPITPSVIVHEDKEWHCADCEVLASTEKINRGRISGAELARLGGGRQERTWKWKRDYLMSLGKEVLVGLLLGAESQSLAGGEGAEHNATTTMMMMEEEEGGVVAPTSSAGRGGGGGGGLRLFDPAFAFATPAAVANAAAAAAAAAAEPSNLVLPTDLEDRAAAQPVRIPLVLPEDDDVYEEPLPYPRMGNGLVLPPEEEDLAVLVDEGVGGPTFSHSWQERGAWRGVLAQQGYGGGRFVGEGMEGMVNGGMGGRMEVSVGA